MLNVKREIMDQTIKEYESVLYNHLFKVNENVNEFFYNMLKDFSTSIWFPILSDLIQYIHILFYLFNENVSYFLFILLYSYHLFIDKINSLNN